MSESRRKKLELLLRRRSSGEIASAAEMLSEHGHSGINRKAAKPASRPAEPMDLAAACGGELAIDKVGGAYWRIVRPLADVTGESTHIADEYAVVMRGARQKFDELTASPAMCHAANANPEDLLMMDIETCGLAGTMIFLIGLMSYRDGQLIFTQLLARDYSEEAAIVNQFAKYYRQCGVLVTFNGKSFDMTQIKDRWTFHRIDAPRDHPPHLDLLHESRRRWKGQLENTKLQTLERHFCGRHRIGDIPGAAIPDAYHRFVSTGDARRLKDIVHHNLLDLLTMAQLVTILLTSCQEGEE